MVGRQTRSIWTHPEGKAIEGLMAGASLNMLPMPLMIWGEWQQSIPETFILSDDTGYSRLVHPSTTRPIRPRRRPVRGQPVAFKFLGDRSRGDQRLPGIPGRVEEAGGVVNYVLAGGPLLVLYNQGSQTGLAYSRTADGQVLGFYNASDQGLELWDKETQSIWIFTARR